MIEILIGHRDGVPTPSLAALALLYGASEEQLEAENPVDLPAAFRESARRRRDEVIAELGADHDVFDALQYWAAKDLSKRIVVCGDEALLGLEVWW